MIEINNLTKEYPDGTVANNNICLTVNNGEVLGIIGPNGSGKTTLFRQILSILKSSHGEILLDGETVDASKIAYIPQFSVVFPSLTVRESIYVALRYQGKKKKEIEMNVQMALEKTGLIDIEDNYSYTLSGGQLKLLSFAILLASDKNIWILDEPTSMVDIVTKEKIWSLFEENRKEKTVIISSHDMAEVKKVCSRIAVINKGAITHEEIVPKEDFAEFYERMMSYVK